MADRPNVVWITLDSVRFDRTSLSDYRRDTTPRIERIATGPRGQWTSEAITQGDFTLSSTASILTGTYPSQHTVGLTTESLGDGFTTFPEVLAEVGYRTACLSRNAYLSEATNLDRGFDDFLCLLPSNLLSVDTLGPLAKYVWNIRTHSAGFTIDTTKHSTSYLLTEIAKKWLGDLAQSEPFLLYLHYNDPHRPYYPPRPYQRRFLDDSDLSLSHAAELSMAVHESLKRRIANGCDLRDREWTALTAMYDGELAHVDSQVGELFDFIRSETGNETIVIITADHGEAFGEHGMLGHKVTLHDAIINVPLVVHGADAIGFEQQDIVQHCDVVKTIAESVGTTGTQFSGVDLRSSARDCAVTQRPSVRSHVEEFLEYNPEFDDARYLLDSVNCLRTGDYKYLQSEGGTRLYSVGDEDEPMKNPSVEADLDERLNEWLRRNGEPITAGERAEFTDEMQRQLEDLGYI